MKIDPKKCVDCGACVPYCPMGAIRHLPDKEMHAISPGDCVECGVCLRSGCCRQDAIFQDDLVWPRTLRAQFSNPISQIKHPTGQGGRGTDEMKTNDVTDRFRQGEIGFGIELGRPGVGAYLRDVEDVCTKLAEAGVTFESENPVTYLIDTVTGKLRDQSVRNERALSFIVEFKIGQENVTRIFKALRDISRGTDTVITVSVISTCEQGRMPPIFRLLQQEGFETYVNGKINLGLGKL